MAGLLAVFVDAVRLTGLLVADLENKFDTSTSQSLKDVLLAAAKLLVVELVLVVVVGRVGLSLG